MDAQTKEIEVTATDGTKLPVSIPVNLEAAVALYGAKQVWKRFAMTLVNGVKSKHAGEVKRAAEGKNGKGRSSVLDNF